jgi:hypothetical protein
MKPRLAEVILVLAALSGSAVAVAEDHGAMDHRMHMANMGEDAREAVDFPAPMRQHMLANMRGHLQALSAILSAMAAGKYVEAADIADEKLGLGSPGAQGCQPGDDKPTAVPMQGGMDMDNMMGQFMPAGMRKAGLAMHQSASDFATVARKGIDAGGAGPASAALAQLTQQCVACHAAYRLR